MRSSFWSTYRLCCDILVSSLIGDTSSTFAVGDVVEVIPQGSDDTEFYLANLGSPDDVDGCTGPTAYYTVCAFEDATTITVLQKSGGSLVEVQNEVIGSFESFTEREFTSDSEEENFAGFVVRSDKNVAVYTGNRCYTYNAVNLATWSSIPSTQNLGTSHVVVPIDADDSEMFVQVVATQDDTDVTVGNGDTVTISEADVAEFGFQAASPLGSVNCSKPCIVMQMVNGSAERAGISQNVLSSSDRLLTNQT